MELIEGKFTVERFAKEYGLNRQSAINLLSKLKKRGFVRVSGGGRQKRIYTVSRFSKKPTNGFYDMVNKYSPEKLQPRFEHYVLGRYTVEHAIIDGIRLKDSRTLEATAHLFRHVEDWKRLFDLAKKYGLKDDIIKLYNHAKESTRCKRIPERYLK
jgi:hypothetical protein